jgi:type IV pilus assembly protein PilV
MTLMLTHGRRARAPGRSGFALIEVLVAILIVSFGMLGIAGLQARTAKMKVNSWARSAAAVQFSDIADRVRSNPEQAGLAFGAPGAAAAISAYASTLDWAAQSGAVPAITNDCAVNNCTDADRVTYDMLVWRREVRRQFPQGSVQLAGNRATGFVATVAWFDKEFVDAANDLQTTPACTAAMAGADRINCCPAGLVGNGVAGVRCSNFSFVP